MPASAVTARGDLPAGVERDVVTMEAPGAPRAGAGGYPVQGFYTRPAGTWPKVALIAAHYNVDFSEHYLSALMAGRGYGFLGWNTRFRGADHFFALDRALVDVGLGVAWLREHGAETIVLLGNSGGGSLMAAYNAQSHGDVLTASFGAPLLPEVHELPAADLYISLAAHPGRPEVLTGWLDPSVTDETDPTSVDPELDMYADGREPPFDAEFVRRYRAGQRARNQRVTDWAKAELARLNAQGVPDRLFLLPRTWADLRFVDPTLDPSDRLDPVLLPGRSPPGQQGRHRCRRHQHPAQLAVHVEPGDLAGPQRAAPGQPDHAVAGHPGHWRLRRLSQRRGHDLQPDRGGGQGPAGHQGRALLPRPARGA